MQDKTVDLGTICFSILNNLGFSEFGVQQKIPNRLSQFPKWHDPENEYFIRIFKKDSKYLQPIFNNLFNVTLDDVEADFFLKYLILMKFWSWQINSQTLEQFKFDLSYNMLLSLEQFNFMARHKEDLFNNSNENFSTAKGANATQPQDEINLDVSNTTLDYGDNFSIGTNKSKNVSYDFNNLANYEMIFNDFLNKLKNKCFLNIF